MSQAVKIALCGLLAGDAALLKLLAKNPDDPGGGPAIFNGTKNQAPPVYDCLTYRLTEETNDKRFRPATPGVPGAANVYTQRVSESFLDCEAWTQTPDSAPLDAINARLDALFHETAFPASGGQVFWSECVMRQSDLYDKTLNAWYSLSRFKLKFQQTS